MKTPLRRLYLLEIGFKPIGEWKEDGGVLFLDGHIPPKSGVYAFCDNDHTYYVGVTTEKLSKRLYFYKRPGVSQKTNLRVKALLLEHLKTKPMHVLFVNAGMRTWKGLPIDMNAGLELSLIKRHTLAWNMRGI